jgi:glycerophosphoryl diester phosphodiesterase
MKIMPNFNMNVSQSGKMVFGREFLVIAHRGASYDAPENTMAAFHLAHKLGADMIELDVQLSADGIPIVFHDSLLDRTSNGSGAPWNYHVKELKLLDAGSWFSASYKGEPIPTLAEVLDWAKDKILVNIEIKPESVSVDNVNGIEKKTIELVKEHGVENKVIISGFDYRSVRRVKEYAPGIRTGLLFNRKSSEGVDYRDLTMQNNADYFHCSWREMNEKRAAVLRDAAIPFLIYTVNSSRLMKKMIRLGASGIFTDKPGLYRSLINSR